MFTILVVVIVGIFLRGYMMYFASGGKRRLVEQISLLVASKDYTQVADMSPGILFVTMALEDKEFFVHKGISLENIRKAARVNRLKKRIVMGGSTITQQLAKNLLFDFKRTYKRKIAEIFAVAVLEKRYSKEEILAVYLNCIEYGNDNWNIKSACQYYFNCLPAEMTIDEAISLLSMLPSPKNYNPISNKEKYYKARSCAVYSLRRAGYLRESECLKIKALKYPDGDLLGHNIERFYREIFSNAMRVAKATRSSLKVEVDSAFTQQILNGDFTSEGLMAYVYGCYTQMKTCYMWGGIMDQVGEDSIELLSGRYGKYYTEAKKTYYRGLIGKEIYGCDCSGLIKSYLFGGVDHPKYVEAYDLNSAMLLSISQVKGAIETLPEMAGICLYMPGHVGIYAGDGQVIECTENKQFGDGVVESNLKDRQWTDWFYCPFVTYNE